MLITALLMVTVFVSSSYCEAYSCCPKCSTESIDQFNYLQLQQIVSQRSVIEEIEQDPQLLYNATYQRSLVNLTKQQNQEILRNFPEIFRDRESFLNTSSTVGTVSQSPAGDGRTRRSVSQLVCPPILGSQPLIIARKPNGEVVELVQVCICNGFSLTAEWSLFFFWNIDLLRRKAVSSNEPLEKLRFYNSGKETQTLVSLRYLSYNSEKGFYRVSPKKT